MKRIYTLLFLVTIINLKAQQFLNSGFENWDNLNAASSWTNDAVAASVNSISQNTLSVQSGTANCKITASSTGGNYISGTISQNLTLASTPYSISFYDKTNLVGGDLFILKIQYFNISNIQKQVQTFTLTPNANVWSLVNIPITPTVAFSSVSNSGYNKIQLDFSLTSANTPTLHAGTYVHLDNFNINFTPTSISETQSSESVNISPNPFNDVLCIKQNADTDNTQIFIYNSFGQLVKQVLLTDFDTLVDVSSLYSGVYYLNFTHLNKSYNQKFIKLN